MTVRPILILPDPLLRVTSEPVERVDADARKLADDMLATMYDAPGVGLAAIQIGVPKRVVVLDCAGKDAEPDPIRLFNPQIVWSSDETNVHEEGCLSIPEFFEDVTRPERVGVRYLDDDGTVREVEWDGLLATCIQHEIDHLNGILFVDHISRLKRERVVRKFQKALREREQGAA